MEKLNKMKKWRERRKRKGNPSVLSAIAGRGEHCSSKQPRSLKISMMGFTTTPGKNKSPMPGTQGKKRGPKDKRTRAAGPPCIRLLSFDVLHSPLSTNLRSLASKESTALRHLCFFLLPSCCSKWLLYHEHGDPAELMTNFRDAPHLLACCDKILVMSPFNWRLTQLLSQVFNFLSTCNLLAFNFTLNF